MKAAHIESYQLYKIKQCYSEFNNVTPRTLQRDVFFLFTLTWISAMLFQRDITELGNYTFFFTMWHTQKNIFCI